MQIKIQNISINPVDAMRRAGYAFQKKTEKDMGFVRPLARSGFPRFHAFIRIENDSLLINLHLDQKRETYGDSTAHHGEYEDSPLVAEELARIEKSIR